MNRSHGLVNFDKYEARINATNYALSHDDGIDVDYAQADLILVGVSRSGKTPTCLYMALHYGVSAANYPLTDDDLDKLELPARLRPYKDRLFGLTIDPSGWRRSASSGVPTAVMPRLSSVAGSWRRPTS